jgi:hypothetical protein
MTFPPLKADESGGAPARRWIAIPNAVHPARCLSAAWVVALRYEGFLYRKTGCDFFVSSASSPERSPPIGIRLRQNFPLGKYRFLHLKDRLKVLT